MSEETDKQLAAFIDIQVARIGVLEQLAIKAAARIDETRDIVSRIARIEERLAGLTAVDQADESNNKDSRDRIRQLEVVLLGDVELREKWEAGKIGYPNIPEPPPGLVQMMEEMHDTMGRTLDVQGQKLINHEAKINKQLEFPRRLEQFFGPMLEGKNPPLDGNEIATKGWVDKQIATFAGAINARVNTAVDFVKELLKQFGYADHGGVSVANNLHWSYARELERDKQERERASRPSRLASLVFAVTGKAPHNGAGR